MSKTLSFARFSIAILITIAACSSNPVDEGEIGIDRTSVSGQVQLKDGASPENVFVWLKSYNVSTWTDEDGNFTIVLPADQREGDGTVQKDTLYFYLSNYFIETAVVSILEGEFLFLRDDVDADGEIRGPIVLQKFLTISTAATFLQGSDSVRVRVTLEADTACANLVNPLIVRHDRRLDPVIDTLGAVIIRPVGEGEITIFRSDPAAAGSEILVPCRNAPVERELIFLPSALSLQPGDYDIIPYLRVEPEGVPLQLLAKLGPELDELSSRYLEKPIRREGGRLNLRNQANFGTER